ncbi:MAG: class I SAM-dependent methyltransferase [Rhizonema sp. NSF051]|nr:class I SAM-dependent methyltransferase [Rhizonema sp. NSF051]
MLPKLNSTSNQSSKGSQENASHRVTSQDIKGSLSSWGMWERLVPDKIADDPASQRILQIHLERYRTAACYAKDKRILDIACGTGYGSQMLHLSGALSVVGVDLSASAIAYAREHYQFPHVKFICANAEMFEISEQFDIVVSFETIEHLLQPDKFLQRIHNLLAREGYLLLSVPLGETRHLDPYHLHAFSQQDIFNLLEETGFSVEEYGCDDYSLSYRDLLKWQQLYPESQASLSDLLFTRRGHQCILDLIRHGGFHIPQLFCVCSRSH